MRTPILVLASLAALTACDKLKTMKAEGDAAVASAAPSASAPTTKAASNAKGDVRTIDGIGDVPNWTADKNAPKCTTTPDAKNKIHGIEAGNDADLAAGKTDIDALVKSTGADACFATRKSLAQALNDGGYHRYGAKKFDEASRYWRAALQVRPSLLLARYNLACGLALFGKNADAIGQLEEIAKAAKADDASANNYLEKAKSDDDLKSVRNDPAFKAAVAASTAHLVGPRDEPETAKKAVPLLPDDFRKVKDEVGVQPSGFWTFHPAVQKFWTWRPTPTTELLVTTVIDDPANKGKPKGDLNQDYGAIAVYQRSGEKLILLLARKTGESPPAVASGKDNSVAYTFDQACGTLSGKLTWNGKAVEVHEKTCQDL
jgi:hypothetical protein